MEVNREELKELIKTFDKIEDVRCFLLDFVVKSIGIQYGSLLLKIQDGKIVKVEGINSFDVLKTDERERFEKWEIKSK